jgi:hypothetical protein
MTMYFAQQIPSATPGGVTSPVAINAAGQVTGSDIPLGAPVTAMRAFVSTYGTTIDLNQADSIGYAINVAGDVAGAFADDSAPDPNLSGRAFLFKNGVAAATPLQPLLPPGAAASNATCVNELQEVGGSWVANGGAGPAYGFVYGAATNEVIDLSSAGIELVVGITNDHKIIGRRADQSGCLYDFAAATVLATLGFDPFAINASGVVVGNTDYAGSGGATRFQGGQSHALPTLGGDYCAAFDVNDAGAVVGSGTYTSGAHGRFDFFALLLAPGATQWTDLNGRVMSAGPWQLSSAFAINSAGQILAIGTNRSDGSDQVLLLTPTIVLSPGQLILAFIQLFGLVSADGGGFGVVGGHVVPIPPMGPDGYRTLWNSLSIGQRDVLTGLAIDVLAAGTSSEELRGDIERVASRLITDGAARLRAHAPSAVGHPGRAKESPRALASGSGRLAGAGVLSPKLQAVLGRGRGRA